MSWAALSPYLYPLSLAGISLLLVVLERVFPWRRDQRQLRPRLWSDVLHLVFNGHFLGVILYGIAVHRVLPHVDRALQAGGLYEGVYRNAAASWPVWVQIVVALLVIDFLQWCVHNLLHRVPVLWEFHKTHHSVQDGEMDWIVSFRFQWTEVVVYKSVLYLPLAFFGFGYEAVMFHAIFGTLVGHFNHANLNLDWGPLKYVLNSPRMHIWHHDYDGDSKTTVNFGIIFSIWDWVFGTAKMPDEPPRHIGFDGVETFPDTFFAQMAWPVRLPQDRVWLPTLVGAGLLAGGWYLAQPPPVAMSTPLRGEVAAASQPAPRTDFDYPASPDEAAAALGALGHQARAAGYAHPEAMASVDEVAAALLAPDLVLLDVRPPDRFEMGHIPGAVRIDRPDYSANNDIPGLSRTAPELQAALRARGVNQDSVLVLYGDGGPEPYRLWWTLRTLTDRPARVLDGGLQAWKQAGHGVAEGQGLWPKVGDVRVVAQGSPDQSRWATVHAHWDGATLVDTRSAVEYTGEEQHRKAAAKGHIPGAHHLDWPRVLDDKSHRLLPPDQIRALVAPLGIRAETRVVTYCQSGTRSAALYFALWQAGHDASRLLNYDGSWAEYSRLGLAVALGPHP